MIDYEAFYDSGYRLLRYAREIQRRHPHIACPGAEDGEDMILRDLLPEPTGVYLDIGAADPIDCSNTWQMYQRGWRGLLVEPLPDYWWRLLDIRRGDLLIPNAIMDYDGEAHLRVCRSCSSLQANWNIDEQGKLYVKTETLPTLLKRFPTIREQCRLLSIDVEGSEREVISGNDWNAFHPEVLVVEWIIHGVPPPNNDSSPQWLPLLVERGYQQVAKTSRNIILKHQ